MSVARNAIQRTLLLAGCTMLATAAFSTPADAVGPTERASTRLSHSTCKAARERAWFERELRRTDGDSEPLTPPEPPECAPAPLAPGMFVNAAMPVRPVAATSPDCETARQQAWIERQLRMSEGDNDPLQPPEPASCKASRAAH